MAADDGYATVHGQTLGVSSNYGVLANDWDDDMDGLTATLVSDVQHGTLTLNGDGSYGGRRWKRLAAPGWVGDDQGGAAEHLLKVQDGRRAGSLPGPAGTTGEAGASGGGVRDYNRRS